MFKRCYSAIDAIESSGQLVNLSSTFESGWIDARFQYYLYG